MVTFIQLLGLMFIGLKLSGSIDWSWWLVFSPLIVSFVFQFLVTLAKVAAK